MRYSVSCFLLSVLFLSGVPASDDCSETLTIINERARLLRKDLEETLRLLEESSLPRDEALRIIISSRRQIKELRHELEDSRQIIGDLKNSYQERILGLRELVSRLEGRLKEQERSNASLEILEEETMEELRATRLRGDILAASGLAVGAGALGWELSHDGWIALGSGTATWLLSYFLLRVIF